MASTFATQEDESWRRKGAMKSEDFKMISKLIGLMHGSGVEELEASDGDLRVKITMFAAAQGRREMHGAAPSDPPVDATVSNEAVDETTSFVCASMQGIFHRAPAPGAEPFVVVGSRISTGQQVGIIEAMKLFTPLLAPTAGVIEQILVENGVEVQAERPLFKVKCNSNTSSDGEAT